MDCKNTTGGECAWPNECIRNGVCKNIPVTTGAAKRVEAPKGQLTIHDYFRAQVVERWTIMNKVRRQSVAEHSWMVTVICMYLYQCIIGFEPDEKSRMEQLILICAAMFHDAPESRTGDIPTPGKRYIEKFLPPPNFDAITEGLMPVIPFIGGVVPVEIQRFVEIADILEAAAWIRENGVGEHARIIAGKTHTRLVQKVERANIETGVDWYEPVNRVLMALGAPIIHHNSWIHEL